MGIERLGMLGLLAAAASATAWAHDSAPPPASGAVEVPAVVIADPRATIVIATPEDGLVTAPAGGFKQAGQAVRAGEVLAWLQPAVTRTERRDLGAELAVQQRDEHLSKLQMDRYQVDGSRPFDVKLPTPTSQLVADYHSAHAQAGQLQRALATAVAIRATGDGVVLRAPARAARTLPAGRTLFELTASPSLAIAVDYTDDAFDAAAATRAEARGGRSLALRYLGGSDDAALRSHRAIYAIEPTAAALFVGEPVGVTMPPRQAAGSLVGTR